MADGTAPVGPVRGGSGPRHSQHRIAVALAAALFAALLDTPVDAQSHPVQYAATVWQTEQGLPQNSVYAMAQDRDGYLWIATGGGLARFDGLRFKVFGPADVPGLNSNLFRSLLTSRSGEVWIGSARRVFRLHEGGVVPYTMPDDLPKGLLESVREDADGALWINTTGGMARSAGGKLQAYTHYRERAVNEFYLQARDGSMWFRSGTDVVRFGADGSLATVPGGFLVNEARDGSIWVALEDQPHLVRHHQGQFSNVPLPPASTRAWTGADPRHGKRVLAADPRQTVLAMATDTDGALLLLTPAGLVRAVDGRLSPPVALPLPANITDAPRVLSLLVDREGNRWVGTLGRGLFRFRRAPLTAYARDEGLSDSPFRVVFQDREGRIWLGGDDALYWFDGHRFNQVPGLTEIGTIAQTADSDLWFGGSGAVHRWRSGVLTRFEIESPEVLQLLVDREETLWVVAPDNRFRRRLYRFRDGTFELVHDDVIQMAEGRDGGLWLAGAFPPTLRYVRGGDKAVSYDQSQGMPPSAAYAMCQDSLGALWFATATGLHRLRHGVFGAITAKKGLTTEVVGMLDDGNGLLWLPSNQGIFRLPLTEVNDVAEGRVSSISPASYGIAEGMKTSECNGGNPGAWKARDGRLWFPTMRGVVAIDPTAMPGPPPVVLEEAWANTIALRSDVQTSAPAGSDTFDFTFTALSLSAPEKQRFKYRLEPHDADWVDAGTRRTAHYTNMRPGEYSFQVMAVNSFGVWSKQPAGVRFVLLPRFYQTTWFRVLCAAVLLALPWGAYQLRVRQLQRQSRQLRDVIDTIPGAVWSALPDGSIDFVSRRWLEFSGTSFEEGVGRGWEALVHPDDVARFMEEFRLAVAGGKALVSEARMRQSDGQYRWLLIRNVPLRDERGRIVKWYGTSTDIDDRKRAEDELREYREHLEDLVEQRTEQVAEAKARADAANRAKSDFLANMSHELRTPLTAIIGFSEVLADKTFGELNAKQGKYVDHVLTAGRHLLNLINDILDLSKVEAGKMELELGPVRIRALLDDGLLLVREKAMKNRLLLSANAPDDLVVTADERKLKQVLFNLLSNAVKFTPEAGRIHVRAEAVSDLLALNEPSDAGDDRSAPAPARDPRPAVRISVSDTGIGIRSDEQGRLFHEFQQLDAGRRQKHRGTGLGLALCRKFVDLHGGRIWVESEGEGKGSTFRFVIPLQPRETDGGRTVSRNGDIREKPSLADEGAA